jgi:hypothetical protein
MLEPDQWDSVLGSITGTIYRNTERISSNALLNLLEVGPDPVTRQKVAKRLVSRMRRLGWTGPRAMRIPAENGHAAGSSGYWRLPSRPPQPTVNVEGDVDTSLSDDLPAALEQVTRLGLKKLERVLRTPLDPTDGNLTRSQVTAAIGAINAQLRADEQQLRRKRSGDVLERLLKLMEEERKKIPVGPIDPFSGPKAPLLRRNQLSMWNAAKPKPAAPRVCRCLGSRPATPRRANAAGWRPPARRFSRHHERSGRREPFAMLRRRSSQANIAPRCSSVWSRDRGPLENRSGTSPKPAEVWEFVGGGP